jgi:quercetin dioxygenase-like cupin family protein
MPFKTAALALLAALALPAFGAAQTLSAPPAVTRTVVAATRLPVVADALLYFKAVSVTLQPGEKSDVSGGDGILYQMSGSTEVTLGGKARNLHAGEALVIAGGETAALVAGNGEPSKFLHFLLLPAAELGRRVETAHGVASEIYRTPTAIQDLQPGVHDLTLTRVAFPAGMASNPPHHRSGAALYYILSGVGANTVAGGTHTRGPGSLIYEPHGLPHQWGNPGDQPLVFLVFNINPEGVAAVVPEAPAK